jgi:hypothetical protein
MVGHMIAVRLGWISLSLALVSGSTLLAEPNVSTQRDLQVGFFLLHEVCHEESPLHFITLVKTTPKEVADFLGRISREADASVETIDAMEARDKSLVIEKNPLPDMELSVRKSIREDKQHQLLFGTSGPAFARALIVTQIEASNYIAHLSKVLAEEDPSPGRAKSLRDLSAKWLSLRDEAYRLLGDQ